MSSLKRMRHETEDKATTVYIEDISSSSDDGEGSEEINCEGKRFEEMKDSTRRPILGGINTRSKQRRNFIPKHN